MASKKTQRRRGNRPEGTGTANPPGWVIFYSGIISTIQKLGIPAIWAYAGVQGVKELAGKNTHAVFKVLLDTAAGDDGAEWIVRGICGIVVAASLIRTHARKKALKEKDEFIAQLQDKIDPDREHSGLLPGA